MKVTIITIVIGELGTVPNGLVHRLEELEIRGRVETIQNTALLRSARILWKILGTCSHSNSRVKLSAIADVKKNIKGVTIILINGIYLKISPK